MGTAIAAGVIGVVATLLGSITAGVMQRRAAMDGHQAAEQAALRRDQVEAVARVAATAADHRRTSYHRRLLEQRGASAQELADAKEEAYATRSAMAEPLARVRLLLPNPAVRAAVEQLVDVTFGLRDTTDVEAGRRASIAAHDRLLDIAGDAIRAAGSH